MTTRESAALRAQLIEKLLTNVVELEQALQADSQNDFLSNTLRGAEKAP
ncbi:MAG: hypothetical protein RML35_05910 [Chloroherpetonaceae bacterium]|nr:hypothetical protein [Chloroherpetonaceae bacterium]